MAKKSVLVVGGTGVLGAAIVKKLRARDFTVCASFCNNQNRAQTLQRETGCQIVRSDAQSEECVAELFAQNRFQSVIFAVGLARDALLLRQSQKSWRETMETNLDAAFLVARESLRVLPTQGQLIFLASRVGEQGFAGQGAYAASKAGVLALMKTAALERRDLTVCALCPGFVESNLSAHISPEKRAQRAAQNILEAPDGKESLAEFVAWILEIEPRVSGQVLRADCRI